MSERDFRRCARCDTALDSAFSVEDDQQPSGGVLCSSRGSYGSRRFDPTGGSVYLSFVLCDSCLVWLVLNGRVLAYRQRRPVLNDLIDAKGIVYTETLIETRTAASAADQKETK
jgi:hypothetical protein